MLQRRIILALSALFTQISFAFADDVNNSNVNVLPPNNYTQYSATFFSNITSGSGWGYVSHYGNFWTSLVPIELFWALVIIVPYLTIYNRTQSIVIPAVLYLFIGGVLGQFMPTFLGQVFYWFIAAGAAGIVYEIYVGQQG